ncbi:MAG: DUF4157 domain-containing protein, partial [Candidatus Methanoperedens sp.]|nr:DUF4157 domain-containing protein [Candidatus Methanoperedens sp.]
AAKAPVANKENKVPKTQKPEFSQSMDSPIEQVLFLQRTIGNRAVKRLIRSGALQAKLKVSQPGDKYEQEADRVAEQVMRTPGSIRRRHPRCIKDKPGKEDEEELLQAKEFSGSTSEVTPELESRINTIHSGGKPLSQSARSYFEPRFGQDFGKVRVHTDRAAAEIVHTLNAHAFTAGQDIFFREGAYNPNGAGGRELLAHELTHVVQQSDTAGLAPSSSTETALCKHTGIGEEREAERDEAEQISVHTKAPGDIVARENIEGLDKRVATFKRLVLSTASKRLASNRENLAGWATLVREVMSPLEIEAQVLATEAKDLYSLNQPWLYDQWAREKNPAMRYVYEQQMQGRWRACTGCHATMQAQDWGARQLQIGPAWTPPSERLPELASQVRPEDRLYVIPWAQQATRMLAGTSPGGTGGSRTCTSCHSAAGFTPPPVSTGLPGASGGGTAFPGVPTSTARVLAAINRIQPIIGQLGSKGYRVLPYAAFSANSAARGLELRTDILDRIAQRREDYLALMQMIGRGEVGYEYFAPIIRDILPLADPDVKTAILKEMDSKKFWALVETIVVGVATVALLLLTIFPPTTALGIAGLGALEVGFGAYALAKSPEMITTGSAYMLGTGANDVFTPEQQDSGALLIFGGFLNLLTSPLLIYSGASRLGSIAITPSPLTLGAGGTTRLLPAGPEVINRGGFVFTKYPDGSVVAEVISRPDLFIVARGNEAVMYQVLAGGAGTRIVARAPFQAAAAPPVLPPFTGTGSTTAMVPATSPSALVPYTGGAAAPPFSPLNLPATLGRATSLSLYPSVEGSLEVGTITAGGATSRVLITPPPRLPLRLPPGTTTDYTLRQIQHMYQPEKWQEAETYFQQVYRGAGQQHFPVPGTGGRFTDVLAPPGGGFQLAGEVKAWHRWVTVEGRAMQQTVPLTPQIEQQIQSDVWLRANVPGYDPRWIFADAPPSPDLAARLNQEHIVTIIHQR